MTPFKNIEDIVAKKDWKYLVRNTLPVNIADSFSFADAMHIVNHLIVASSEEMAQDCFIADLMRDYSVNLMTVLRAKFPKEWKRDWKNEAFLGVICGLIYREEEAFQYIQGVYEQLQDAPQSLILAYISAGSGPDHFLSNEKITELANRAINKAITYEAALKMVLLAYNQKDTDQQKYWENIANEAEKKGIHTPIIVPNVLKDVFNKECGCSYEE